MNDRHILSIKISFLAMLPLTEHCTCKTRNLVDRLSSLLSKIDQTGVFSLVRLKPFEIYFYFVMFSISSQIFL